MPMTTMPMTTMPMTIMPMMNRDESTGNRPLVTLRPIRTDDAPGLIDFHRHLSPLSVYRRFFSVHPRLSAAEVERFTCVDAVDRLALVAEDDGCLVAVGRYDRDPGTPEAEVAFVVADRYQHQGIAPLLLDALAAAAWPRGIRTFTAVVLPENRDMLDVFRHSGFVVATGVDDGVVSVRITLSERHPPAELGAPPGPGTDGEGAAEGGGPVRTTGRGRRGPWRRSPDRRRRP
jgi:GNAT superfamily N-acetyltransferase